MIKYQNENIGESYSFKCRFHNKYIIPPHIHEYSEIAYVTSGTLTAYINGERITVPEKHCAFIFPNEIHEYTAETKCSLWCAVFSNDFIQTFFRLHSDSTPKNCVIDISEKQELMNELVILQGEQVLKRAAILHMLFAELESQTEFIDRNKSNDSLYHSAINYISQNFRSDITLSDMAKSLGYHEKYLSSTLHSLTKMNFRAFLATYRLNHAKALLRGTESTVAEIAMESGFSSLNTFNRIFKAATGKTPSEYRKS